MDRSQARSMVISQDGIVATEHPLASQAGAVVLAEGGNAVDAAIAANAAMGVVSPMMCGMGGDLFALVYIAEEERLYGLNASGWAPKKLTQQYMIDKGFEEMPIRGVESITVPGCVHGWSMLRSRFGRRSFQEILSPAIHYAENGFPVAEWVASYWSGSEDLLSKDPNAASTFLVDGLPPTVGQIVHNRDMAWSLRQIADQGEHAFYEGAIASRILKFMEEHEGPMTAEDLSEFSAEWVDPISTTYRDWTVYEIPPNGQGIAALIMLNLMEQFPMSDYGHLSVPSLHAMIESKKLAYADMKRFVADPAFSDVPVTGLLSKSYALERSKRIDLNTAHCEVDHGDPMPRGSDTTYLCTVDGDGNMVSLIQSIYYGFGSGKVAKGTGFALQNRGALFTLDEEHPNALEPRKRPLHTIIPGFMEKGDVRIAFGIMGGWNQSQAHAQFVSDIVDHGLNIQQALEAPRFTKMTFDGCDVQMENRIPKEVRDQLSRRGHEIQVQGAFTPSVGGGQAVLRDFSKGVNYGASDPRKDGQAVIEPPLK